MGHGAFDHRLRFRLFEPKRREMSVGFRQIILSASSFYARFDGRHPSPVGWHLIHHDVCRPLLRRCRVRSGRSAAVGRRCDCDGRLRRRADRGLAVGVAVDGQ